MNPTKFLHLHVLTVGALCIGVMSVRSEAVEGDKQHFHMPNRVVIEAVGEQSPCYAYARSELARLLKGVGVDSEAQSIDNGTGWHLRISRDPRPDVPLPDLNGNYDDGFRIAIDEDSITLSGSQPKGLLNATYAFAERLGYVFLYPGSEGEWAPKNPDLLFPIGTTEFHSRFPHRGIFNGSTDTEWLEYYAKLGLNTVCNPVPRDMAERYGFRIEQGGHELDELLPYDQLETHPEMYRMDQPEDFFGKRVADYNFCVASPRARQIIQGNYRVRIRDLAAQNIYAWHTWPEDLSASAWCLCPTCRSLAPADQAMVAMRFLADVIRDAESPMRVPMLAYHDTMFPGPKIDAPPETFLLFAPRERCYGHALNDPACPKNADYLRALKAWSDKYAHTDDAHTFEYYLDRVLFRGLYPFLPDVILDDMRVYESHGIETHLTLQVGTAFVPRLTMLNLPLFARATWQPNLTAEQFISEWAHRIEPDDPQPWIDYFTARAELFAAIMRWEHAVDGWSDYRWIPESPLPYGHEMAIIYRDSSAALARTAQDLEAAIQSSWPHRVQELAHSEAARTRFEAAEVAAMVEQQEAANAIGAYLNGVGDDALRDGVDHLKRSIGLFQQAKALAALAGIEDGDYYYMFNAWIQKEIAAKIAHWEEDALPR